MTDEEQAEDQALIARVAAEVQRDLGVELDQLINPSKVINLERKLVKLQKELDAGPAQARRVAIEKEMSKSQDTLLVEKRAIIRSWLKNLFVGQSVLSVIIAGFMVYDRVPGFEHVDLSVRVLGFWLIWLFTLPSLRARKPSDAEKAALNIAFLATPLTNLAAPFVTKDPVTIYWANLAVVAACYLYGFTIGRPGEDADEEANAPEWLKFVYKALDFGAGRERGARK